MCKYKIDTMTHQPKTNVYLFTSRTDMPVAHKLHMIQSRIVETVLTLAVYVVLLRERDYSLSTCPELLVYNAMQT